MSDLYAVTVQAQAWQHDQRKADEQRGRLIAAVRAAHANGVSEYALAKAAGVTRNTVRSWLGKGGA
jgi:transposase